MINYINGKIKGVPYIQTPEEQGRYYAMLSNCLMSQGAMSAAPRIKIDNKIILLGKNVQHFGIKLMNLKSKTTKINGFDIDTVELWKAFKEMVCALFPAAQAEALAKSKELPKKEQSKMGYDFTSEG